MAEKPAQVIYWDACCLIGFLKAEPGKVDACQRVLEAAAAGEALLVTSALTIVEVVHVGQQPPLPPEDEAKIVKFLERAEFVVVPFERAQAEEARRLMWQEGLKRQDAIHLSTAVWRKIEVFHTYDPALLALSGKVGNPKIEIRKPDWMKQEKIEAKSVIEQKAPK